MERRTTVPSLLSPTRNCCCNCLAPPSSSAIDTYMYSHNSVSSTEDESPQHLTIIFGGRVSVCDVTELQAKEILNLARRGMKTTPTPAVQSQQLQNPNGICMQRSLQRFLEKRKSRIQATSPYMYNKPQP